MSASRLAKIKQVLSQRQLDFTVVLENVHKTHNLAAIVRSCDAVGLAKLHAITNDSLNISTHTSSGSNKWITVQKHKDINNCFTELRKQGMKIYAAHLAKNAVDYRQIDYTKPTAILMGQEKLDVTTNALEQIDGCITIPMLGMVESLNVSVATAIILYEMQRQHEENDLYNQQQIDNSELKRLVF